MHEYAVTESILEIVQAQARQNGARRIDEVTVVIGELTSFRGESIQFYFDELARGTLAEGALIHLQPMEARAVCRDCGTGFRPRHAFFVCPECGSGAYDLTQGNELFIDNIEVSS